jgi:capsular exopolysaccharide synthesis family protein
VDLRVYWEIVKRRRWLVIGPTVACFIGAFAISTQITPIYEGITRVEILPVVSGNSQGGVLEKLLDPTWARTQVEVIESDLVLDRAAGSLGGDVTAERIGEVLQVELVPETQIVDISIQHPSPLEAAEWANTVAASFIDYRRESAIESTQNVTAQIARQIQAVDEDLSQLGNGADVAAQRSNLQAKRTALELQLLQIPDNEGLSQGGGNVMSAADIPEDPIRPNLPVNLATALALGVIIGLGAAFLMDNLDDHLKTTEEVEQKVAVPALGYIPLIKDWSTTEVRRLADDDPSAAPASEAYRTLGINLLAAARGQSPGVILITSASAEAGKSTTSANLAAVLAGSGHKVILVAGDLRKPSIHKFFGLPNVNGVVDVVNGLHPLDTALQTNSLPNFRLLSAGDIRSNPTETLGSGRFAEVLEQLKAIADVVLIDSTPILGLGDASVLASKVDGVILVIHMADARGRLLSHAVQQVDKAGGRLIGCVINGMDPEGGYGGYYGYGYK